MIFFHRFFFFQFFIVVKFVYRSDALHSRICGVKYEMMMSAPRINKKSKVQSFCLLKLVVKSFHENQ